MIPAIFTVGGAVSNEAENVSTKNQKGKLVVTCNIRGVQFRGEEATSDCEKYAFLLRNKKTGKIRVIERPPLYFRPSMPDEGEDPGTITQDIERGALAENFGSSKLRKTVKEIKDRDQIAGNTRDLKAAVLVATEEMKKREDTQTVSQITPPILDLKASSPAGVYDMNAILPPHVRMALKGKAEELIASTQEQRTLWLKEETYCKLVVNRLPSLPIDPKEKRESATRLAFFQSMSEMYKTSAKVLRSSTALSEMPREVTQFLLSHFTMLTETTTRKVRCCPAWMKENLMCHMLVVLLYNDNFTLSIPELVEYFKMSSQRLTKYLNTIGCKISSSGQKKTAILQTPVVFQILKNA